MKRSRASHMSRSCGLWQRKLPFAGGMGSASTTPVLRWWSSSQVGGSSAASAAVAAANGRPWHPPAQSGAVGCCRPVRDRWRRSQRRVELQFKKVKLVYRTARAPSPCCNPAKCRMYRFSRESVIYPLYRINEVSIAHRSRVLYRAHRSRAPAARPTRTTRAPLARGARGAPR